MLLVIGAMDKWFWVLNLLFALVGCMFVSGGEFFVEIRFLACAIVGGCG